MKKLIILITMACASLGSFAMDTDLNVKPNQFATLPVELQKEVLLKVPGENLKDAWKNVSALLISSKSSKALLQNEAFKKQLLKSLVEGFVPLTNLTLSNIKADYNDLIVAIAQQLGFLVENTDRYKYPAALDFVLSQLNIDPNDSQRGKKYSVALYNAVEAAQLGRLKTEKNVSLGYVESLRPYEVNAIRILLKYGATPHPLHKPLLEFFGLRENVNNKEMNNEEK